MTELTEQKKNLFIGLFGKKAGLKLLHWLDPCCTSFCDDIKECVGISSSGDPNLFLSKSGAFASPTGESITVTLTSSQILSLNTSPVTIIPAPGVGKAIIVDEVLFKMNYVTSAYAGGNPANIKYTNASGDIVSNGIPSSVLEITSGSTTFFSRGNSNILAANKPVVIVVDMANPTAGGGNATVTIKHRIITL